MSSDLFAGVFGIQERRVIPTQAEKTAQAFTSVDDVLEILTDIQADLAACQRSNAAVAETTRRLAAPLPMPPKYVASATKSTTPPPQAPTKPVMIFKAAGSLLECIEIGRRPA